jgi:hypothetical protein
MSRTRKNTTHRLTEAETAGLMAHTRREADRARLTGGSRRVVDEILVHLLLETCIRPQEVCALNVGDTPAHCHGLSLLTLQTPARKEDDAACRRQWPTPLWVRIPLTGIGRPDPNRPRAALMALGDWRRRIPACGLEPVARDRSLPIGALPLWPACGGHPDRVGKCFPHTPLGSNPAGWDRTARPE